MIEISKKQKYTLEMKLQKLLKKKNYSLVAINKKNHFCPVKN